MLTIGKLGASVDQLAYYEQQVAQGMEDYFSGRGEAPGRWIGGGCGGVGVSGRVDRDAFMSAMDGCDPRTGERLRPDHGRTKVAAFDLTFSAPKSVSVLFAIADEQTSGALMEAHRLAVEAAFAYVEREACFTRRGRNGVRRVRGDGFLATAYRHRLSRAGDPQLHTHVVVANMTRAEGRWTSLEAHGLYEHKSAAGVYRAVLRAEVRKRLPWVWWRRVGRGLFEIEGVPDGVLREFLEQSAATRALATDGQGVSILQALAGTGKTRVLGALARIYEAAGWRVVGVAPTGRAARELGDTAGIATFTIHRLLSELDGAGPFAPNTVVLFDEAGTAPTRPSAELFARAETAGAKVIVVGDSGQLPSVAAGGWLAAIAGTLGGPELRQVVRQLDPAEREPLESLHEGDPEPYLALKREQRALSVHEREGDAVAAILLDWNAARREHGLSHAVTTPETTPPERC